jgi:hypothetical protein
VPWTPKQTRYLLSKVSPLSGTQKSKMKGELHSDPSMAHARKGSSVLSKAVERSKRR